MSLTDGLGLLEASLLFLLPQLLAFSEPWRYLLVFLFLNIFDEVLTSLLNIFKFVLVLLKENLDFRVNQGFLPLRMHI